MPTGTPGATATATAAQIGPGSGQTPTGPSGTPGSTNPGGSPDSGNQSGPGMSFFLLIGGIVITFIVVALLGMLFLRHLLLPSPLRKSKMSPSGARPWRSPASMQGFTSWHGTPVSGPPQPQAQRATALPAASNPFAPPPWLNQDAPFSQAAAAWSQAHAGPGQIAPPGQPQWTPLQQTAPQNSFSTQPQNNLRSQPQNSFSTQPQPVSWNATPFVSQHQPPAGWQGHTFASWNQQPAAGANDAPAKGNTGKFRRNSLLPFADVQQPGTNRNWGK